MAGLSAGDACIGPSRANTLAISGSLYAPEALADLPLRALSSSEECALYCRGERASRVRRLNLAG